MKSFPNHYFFSFHPKVGFIQVWIFVFFMTFLAPEGVQGMNSFESVYNNVLLENDEINPEMRQKWIEETVIKLQEIKKGNCQHSIETRVVDLDDFFMVSYRLKGPEGCIEFPNGDWAYLRSHSAHQNQEIGDITVALDNFQRVYINQGHVCGGIINFYFGSAEYFLGADFFFENFLSDTDDLKWYKISNMLQKNKR